LAGPAAASTGRVDATDAVLELKRSDGLLYTLGPDHPPVLSVEPGARIRIETELNIGDVLHADDDVFSVEMVRPPWLNPATGPIEIRGASAAHIVVCDIEQIEVHSPGLTGLVPGLSPFPDWIREREFGVHANVVRIADGLIEWPGGPPIPVKPMVGVIGCAPLVEAVSTVDNGRHGGNLDVQEIGPGCRVFLPSQSTGRCSRSATATPARATASCAAWAGSSAGRTRPSAWIWRPARPRCAGRGSRRRPRSA
jgi:acetamidase/formamidase